VDAIGRAIMALVTVFQPESGTPTFATPTIARVGEAIVVQGRLDGARTPALDRIVHTGAAEITVTFDGKITKDAVVVQSVSVHVLRYDLLTRTYTVLVDGAARSFDDEREATSAFESYTLAFQAPGVAGVTLRIDAHVEYESAMAIDVPDDALWGYRAPWVIVRDVVVAGGAP
jgi:hypothetical protein